MWKPTISTSLKQELLKKYGKFDKIMAFMFKIMDIFGQTSLATPRTGSIIQTSTRIPPLFFEKPCGGKLEWRGGPLQFVTDGSVSDVF